MLEKNYEKIMGAFKSTIDQLKSRKTKLEDKQVDNMGKIGELQVKIADLKLTNDQHQTEKEMCLRTIEKLEDIFLA